MKYLKAQQHQMESKKQSKSQMSFGKECIYCGGQCSHIYAQDASDTRRCFCSRPCLQAYETDRLKELLGSRMEFYEDEVEPPLWVTRLFDIEVVFIRALLKGTTKNNLERFKTILMDRCVDAIENSTDDGDEIYKGMADATKAMLLNYEFWIKVLGK